MASVVIIGTILVMFSMVRIGINCIQTSSAIQQIIPVITNSRLLVHKHSPIRLFATSPKINTVAIIGGGIAGLACAERLAEKFNVTVYDTGRLRPGGRCSSRLSNDKSRDTHRTTSNIDDYQDDYLESIRHQHSINGILSRYTYDHAAQIVSIPKHPRFKSFRKQVEKWEENGVIQKFPRNTLYNIMSYKKAEPINNQTFYYGTTNGGGMGGIPSYMVQSSGGIYTMQQNIWVSPRNGVQHMINQNQWKVQGETKKPGILGMYDAIVIAHNGKCADRLMSLTPVTDIHKLLKVQFKHQLRLDGGGCMTLNSIYSLTFAIPAKDSILSKNLPATFMSGFVRNHPDIRFLTCQTRKYGMNTNDNIEVWTVLSSGKFGKQHKAPQESLPNEVVGTVTRLLFAAIEEAVTGIKSPFPVEGKLIPPSKIEKSVLDLHLQLWGAAIPMNVWDIERGRTPAGFLYDGEYRVGVCGDWLVEASIAGAWTSGRLLADYMLSNTTKSHGFMGSFTRSIITAKAGIGRLEL